MLDRLKVSVIIPVYNVEKLLDRCLKSVINQTYRNIEIIIINDGSPDSSQNIIDDYAKKDDRILFAIQANGGLSSARNAGMKMSSGDYYFFLDSDDYLSENAIDILMDKAVLTNADITIGNFSVSNTSGKIYCKPPYKNKDLEIGGEANSKNKFDYFFGRAYGINAWNRLYKKCFVDNLHIIFEENNVIYAEDLLFNLKLFINNPKISLVNEYTYFYYNNENSITKSKKVDLSKRFINLMESFINYNNSLLKPTQIDDLLCYVFMIAISNSCLEIALNENCWFNSMKEEIKIYLLYSSKYRFLKIKYLLLVDKIDFKAFYALFLMLCRIKALSLATAMQLFRYKLYVMEKNNE